MGHTYKKLALLFGDIALFYASLFVALSLRKLSLISTSYWNEHWPPFSIVLIIWIVVFFINDLYNLRTVHYAPALLNKIIGSMLINLVITSSFFYITAKYFSLKPQTILLLTTLIFSILFYLWRQIVNYFFTSDVFANNLIFIGFNKITSELIDFIEKRPHLGFRVKTIIDDEKPTHERVNALALADEGVKKLFADANSSHTIVLSLHHYQNKELLNLLYAHLTPRTTIVSLPKFYEFTTGKIPINQIGQAWVLENFMGEPRKMFNALKRLMDIVSATVLGIIAIILTPFIALAIYLESGLPIFFKQTRVGYMGKNFLAVKFRTMVKDSEKSGPMWAVKNDPRVTRVGRFLRKTRLDELPQLLNVLKGDMSLVGSRPERPEFVQDLVKEIPFYKERLLVKPGLTGWAQVNFPYGASKEDALEKLQYDLYYLKNRSLGLELSIILKTIRTVLTQKGQ